MTPHYHHHLGNHACQQALSKPSCCCSCNCHCSSHSLSHSPLPLPMPTDQRLQSVATNLLNTQTFLKPHQIYYQSLVQDLIKRVSILETSFSRLSARSPPHSPARPSLPLQRRASPPSLREAAARIIQLWFRRFLVRQSQALGGLKLLASIKSRAAALRSSISSEAGAKPEALSQKAMDLLLQLDSIQSLDPMVRDGKRSIKRELARLLEFVDKVLVRETQPCLRARVDPEAPLQRPRSSKRVSFADNGMRYEEISEGGFSRVCDLADDFEIQNGDFLNGKNDDFGLFAPLPLQMEPRLHHKC